MKRIVLVALLVGTGVSAETLTPWEPGFLDIHQISTGKGNAAFFVFPDGTTLLLDAGAVTAPIAYATARPDDSRTPGEWISRYVRRMHPEENPVLDYALITHFHGDHMGYADDEAPWSSSGEYRLAGITEVGELIPIRTMIDRGWPDYDYPAPIENDNMVNYRRFLEVQSERRGMKVERLEPGRNDQIVLEHSPESYAAFEVRNLAANGVVWTGVGTSVRRHIPPLDTLAPEDFPNENQCSLALRVSYGSFDYYTGGDLSGIPNVGHPEWQNLETPVAKAIGPVEVHVVNHHGSIDPASPFFLASLRPRVHIVPAWAPTHPAPSVLKRLLSERAYPGPRDVFIIQFREPTKVAIGPRAERVQSDGGHVVVRVAPGGATYRVLVLDDSAETFEVESIHGPYESQ
jgi:beta-lactamase superfamily II metal-dependent hydrolase